ncbi:trypsin alpha-3-like [Bacillus rossius redtenbacheri]|uniref:trypsin alpha-3-like n=1 Tax=Bacillus rossius redtenbacheri TaxID=93214 RepID=UPI002FDD1699
MFRTLFACYLIFCANGASVQLDERIIGGHEISINEAPYQAGILLNGQHICGAVIISSAFVLSAAHCSLHCNALYVYIRVGSSNANSGGYEHGATQIINHASYYSKPVPNHDISLIRVGIPFEYLPTVRAISLASEVPAAGSSVVTSGWGATSEGGAVSDQLLQVQVEVVDQAQCNHSYSHEIKDTMVCAGVSGGGKGTCLTDSGGPLVQAGKLVGIVSFGFGCARKGYPGVYASVPYFRHWIKIHAGV